MQSAATTAVRPISVSAPTTALRRFDHEIEEGSLGELERRGREDDNPRPRLLEDEDREEDREDEHHPDP